MYVERNKFIVIKIKYETWIAKQFIATEVLQWPLSIPLATQTHLPLQDTRILTWWRPPKAEKCRFIIKIPYISCNKLFSNSCLVFNLNYYKFVVLEVHTLLFGILISTTGMIHLNICYWTLTWKSLKNTHIPLKSNINIDHFTLTPKYILFLAATLIRHKYVVLYLRCVSFLRILVL